jgi:two-component system nitrate/nitrite response regulator NarP
MKTSVVIADASTELVQRLREMAELGGHLYVVAEATAPEHVVELVEQLDPDAVLVGGRLSVPTRFQTTRLLRERAIGTPVITVLESYLADVIHRAVEAGVSALVAESDGSDSIAAVAERAAAGAALVPAGVASVARENAVDQVDLSDLTPRELEVLDLLAKGISNKEIAVELGLRAGSVGNVVSNVLDKLGVQSRYQAALKVLQV